MELIYNFLSSAKFRLQIEKVIANTVYMYASIKGIAGNAIQSIPQLELEG